MSTNSQAAPNGVNGIVSALAGFDDGTGEALYVTVDLPDGHRKVMKWDGTRWSFLPGSSSGSDPLTVYGKFLLAGGPPIMKWDGSSWSTFAEMSNSTYGANCQVMMAYKDTLYVGGEFDNIGGVAANNIAMWDGASWHPLSGPSGNGMSSSSPSVTALALYPPPSTLYAGGTFGEAGGVTVSSIANWNGTAWSSPSTGLTLLQGNPPPPLGTCSSLAVFDDGAGKALFAGGLFNGAGGATASNIAKWTGAKWIPLPSINNTNYNSSPAAAVNSLTVYDDGGGDALFAAGTFENAGKAKGVNSVAKWDGTRWSPLTSPSGKSGVTSGGDQKEGFVSVLYVYDQALYVGGVFDAAGGVPAKNIAKWDGTRWSSLP